MTSLAATDLSPEGLARVQRRTLTVLFVAQAMGGLGNTIGIAVASVLAFHISGDESLAGLVQTMQVLGAAAASYLLARLMGTRGRRVGLVTGYLVGATGAATCVVGGVLESFPILLFGAVMLGANSATGLQSRYAAADLAVPAHRARALSLVLWATTVGAVLGPNLVGAAVGLAEQLGLPGLTGPFLVTSVVVLLAALVLAAFLRPDPLLLARAAAGIVDDPTRDRSWRRAIPLCRERPAIPAAVLAMSAAHAVMVSVMVMTPLHMSDGGATLRVIGLVISVHVLGMFAFAPLFGILCDRVGRRPVLLAGALTLWVSLWLAGRSPMGSSPQIAIGLFLLGVGWSCCTVAAAALLTEATPLEDRTDVQGLADLLMNCSAAAAGALSGLVVGTLGFGHLNLFAAVLVMGVFASLAVLSRDALGGSRSVAG